MKIDPLIKDQLKEYLNQKIVENKQLVTVTGAYDFTAEDKTVFFQSLPEMTKAKVRFLVDRSLIAGIVLQIGSKVIDLSIKGRLLSFNKLLYETD